MIKIHRDDWPGCAKCNMPVENFFVTDTGSELTFVAQCHGMEQSVKVPDCFWEGQHVSVALAFEGE